MKDIRSVLRGNPYQLYLFADLLYANRRHGVSYKGLTLYT